MTTHNAGPRNSIQLERPALEFRDPGCGNGDSLDRLRSLGIVAPKRVGPAHAKYELPWPPSVNELRAVVHGRLITTKVARQYERAAVAALLAQSSGDRRNRFLKPDRVAVVIVAHPPHRQPFDLDNRVKAAADAMTKGGVFDDDSQIDDLRIIRAGVVPGGKLVIGLWRLGDVAQQILF